VGPLGTARVPTHTVALSGGLQKLLASNPGTQKVLGKLGMLALRMAAGLSSSALCSYILSILRKEFLSTILYGAVRVAEYEYVRMCVWVRGGMFEQKYKEETVASPLQYTAHHHNTQPFHKLTIHTHKQ